MEKIKMKIFSLLFLIILFTSSLYAEPIPGIYSDNSLLIGVDKKENTVSGYYNNYSGWDEISNRPRFSCIFYLKGALTSGNIYKIKTGDCHHTQPGQSINQWENPGAGPGCLGACLLFKISESQT